LAPSFPLFSHCIPFTLSVFSSTSLGFEESQWRTPWVPHPPKTLIHLTPRHRQCLLLLLVTQRNRHRRRHRHQLAIRAMLPLRVWQFRIRFLRGAPLLAINSTLKFWRTVPSSTNSTCSRKELTCSADWISATSCSSTPLFLGFMLVRSASKV